MYILQIRCYSLWRSVVSSMDTNFWRNVLPPVFRIKNTDRAVSSETSLSINYLAQNAEIYLKTSNLIIVNWVKQERKHFPGIYEPPKNYRRQKAVTQHFVFWRPGFVHPWCRFQHALLQNILLPPLPPPSPLKVHNQPLWNMVHGKLYFLLWPLYSCAFYGG
jgi:hypothetical protein